MVSIYFLKEKKHVDGIGVYMSLALKYFLLNRLIRKVYRCIKWILWFVYMHTALAFKDIFSLKHWRKFKQEGKILKIIFQARFILAVTFRKLCSVPSFEYCIWTLIHNCSHQFTDNHLLGHYSHILISNVKLKWQQTILEAKVKVVIAPLNFYEESGVKKQYYC